MSPLDLIVWAIAILIAAVCLMLATFAIVGAVRYIKVNRAAWRGVSAPTRETWHVN